MAGLADGRTPAVDQGCSRACVPRQKDSPGTGEDEEDGDRSLQVQARELQASTGPRLLHDGLLDGDGDRVAQGLSAGAEEGQAPAPRAAYPVPGAHDCA
jgi:hypothetical protein